MIIIRCWLEKLFKCVFECACFNQSLFNPELINILFDNDKTIPLQIGLKRALLWTNNKIFENALKFSLNHLSISESLSIDLDATSEQYTDILFNTLINEGNKFPKISLKFPAINLYNLIVKYVTTSKDCSKIVPFIHFDRISAINFKLNERAENVEIDQSNGNNSTKYQVANIYNPKVRFEFYNRGWNDELFNYIQIRKMEV
uniref:Uncharacterized protein n=1 Tax=Meloidogyne enterolobii TaxID=390850 RepID=A0A6V7VZA1_MELEN|nr:unnamed protein product [Meloidogyne enterolobii]